MNVRRESYNNLYQLKFNHQEKDCIEKFRKFVDYMSRITTPTYESLKEDFYEKIGNLFNQIESLVNTSENHKKILEILCDHELNKIHLNIIEFCFNYLIDSVNEIRILQSQSNTKQQIEKILKKSYTIYNSLNGLLQLSLCLSNFCLVYRQSFHSLSGTMLLLKMLSDDLFVDYFILLKIKLENFEYDDHSLMKSIIGSLYNLTKSVNLQDLNATKVLLLHAHKMKEMKLDLMQIYIILANILTDKEIGQLTDTIDIVNKLAEMISKCSKNIIQNSRLLHRVKIELDGCQDFVCYVVDKTNIRWDLTELINGLYRIAVNDEIKYYVYSNCRIKSIVEVIVNNGTSIEKAFAIKLLYQLSFDENVAGLIRNDNSMIMLIESLADSSKENNANSKFLKDSKNLLWRIQSKPNVSLSSNGEKQQKQIMISYNRNSRDVCLKIKKELEKMGFKIWIDVENIHGSSLEAMATAIEESDLILICMTEKYKMSPNCRAEAEYTFNIRKNYIPLIMQESYKPDGWLGLLLGAKIFVDFTKYAFEESFSRLQKEVSQLLNLSLEPKVKEDQPKQQQQSLTSTLNNANLTNKKSLSDWNQDMVKNWLNENFIDSYIQFKLKNFTGEMLIELNQMKSTAPDFFYNSISTPSRADLESIIKFTLCLKKLINSFQQK